MKTQTFIISNETAEALLNSKKKEAKNLLKNKDKFDMFTERLERKLNNIPKVGKTLSLVPVLAEMVKMYVEKKYTELPLGTILSVLAALIYFVLPIDLISDVIPAIGYLDDIAVISVCIKYLANDDIREFKEWREKTFSEEKEG